MQVNLVNSRPNEPNFGKSKLIGGLKTVSRGINAGLKHGEGLYDEADKLNFSNQSKVVAFMKKSLAYYFAPIYIPIRRALKGFKEPY